MQASLLVLIAIFTVSVFGGSKDKKHGAAPVLVPSDGSHMPYTITFDENEKLLKGEPVNLMKCRYINTY